MGEKLVRNGTYEHALAFVQGMAHTSWGIDWLIQAINEVQNPTQKGPSAA